MRESGTFLVVGVGENEQVKLLMESSGSIQIPTA